MQYWADILNRAMMFSSLAIALNLLFGYAGYLSLAHAAFFGVGAYCGALVAIHLHLGFAASTLVAVVFSGILGSALSFPAIRISGEYLILLTLAFIEVVSQLENSWIPLTGGNTGLFPIPAVNIFGYAPSSPSDFLPMTAVVLVVVFAICWRIGQSPYGRVLRAIREDPRAARALGKNITRFQVQLFGITAGLAGLVGSMWAHYFLFITPDTFNLNQTIFISAIVVLGGTGNLWGSVIGGVVLTFLQPILQQFNLGDQAAPAVQQIIYGLALVVVIRYRPSGLFPERLPSMGVRTNRLARAQRQRGQPIQLDQNHDGADGASDFGAANGVAIPDQVPESAKVASANGSAALAGRDLTKRFGGLTALDGVDFQLQAGSITVLVGPNGAGKTTLFNVLTGDIRADDGAVYLHGQKIKQMRPDVLTRQGVARSFQDVRIFQRLSVLENVAIAAPSNSGESLVSLFFRPRKVARDERQARLRGEGLLKTIDLTSEASLPAGALGYAEQKLLGVCRLLLTGCSVLLLDEPSAGMDPPSANRVRQLVDDMATDGKAVCIVEHNLDGLQRFGGEAYFLEEGKIVAQGTIAELMNDPALAVSYFGG